MSIKIGFVGAGWVCTHIWLPLLQKHDEIECIIGYDMDIKKVKVASKQNNKLIVSKSLEELIHFKPNLVFILTPNYTHKNLATLFIQSGIPVFVEKPICMSLSEYHYLVTLINKLKIPFFPSKTPIYRSDIKMLKAFLEKNVIGDLFFIELRWNRAKGIPGTDTWFTSRKFSGGGVAIDLGWHLFDVLFYLIENCTLKENIIHLEQNYLKQTSYDANWKDSNKNKSKQVLKKDVEDNAVFFIKTHTNISVMMHLSWASEEAYDKTSIVLHGSRGILRLHTTFGFSPYREKNPRIELQKNGQTEIFKTDHYSLGEEFVNQLNAIIETIKSKTNNMLCDMKNIKEYMRLYECAYQND